MQQVILKLPSSTLNVDVVRIRAVNIPVFTISLGVFVHNVFEQCLIAYIKVEKIQIYKEAADNLRQTTNWHSCQLALLLGDQHALRQKFPITKDGSVQYLYLGKWAGRPIYETFDVWKGERTSITSLLITTHHKRDVRKPIQPSAWLQYSLWTNSTGLPWIIVHSEQIKIFSRMVTIS